MQTLVCLRDLVESQTVRFDGIIDCLVDSAEIVDRPPDLPKAKDCLPEPKDCRPNVPEPEDCLKNLTDK